MGTPNWKLKEEGTGPAMLEAITGELRIQVKKPGQFKCWTLDVTGKRREQVPIEARKGQIVLDLRASQKAVYYELEKQ
jgi:hypothetical protein